MFELHKKQANKQQNSAKLLRERSFLRKELAFKFCTKKV